MDPLTHGLLGAVTAKVVLGRRLGHSAWLIGATAGMLPDVDFFIGSSSDPLLNIEYHRQFTHSLAFIPVGGVLAALPWLAVSKLRSQWQWVLAAGVLGYATHGLLDTCTTYGTHLLWPFSPERSSWNLMTTIGPLFTLALLLGLIFSSVRKSRLPAMLALMFCAVYVGGAAVQRGRVEQSLAQIAEARVQQSGNQLMPAAVSRWEIFPTVGNPLVWRTLYQVGNTLYADRVRVPLTSEPLWKSGATMTQVEVADLTPEERSDPRVCRDFGRFRYFSAGWLARAPRDPSVLADARYSLQSDVFEPIWGVRFHPGQPVPTEWVARDRERKVSLREFWQEMIGTAEGYLPLKSAGTATTGTLPDSAGILSQQVVCRPA